MTHAQENLQETFTTRLILETSNLHVRTRFVAQVLNLLNSMIGYWHDTVVWLSVDCGAQYRGVESFRPTIVF